MLSRRERSRTNRPRKSSRSRKVGFESLEARRVLATYFVDTPVDQLPALGDACAPDNATLNNNCTIRLAIQEAESNAGPDTIEIPTGTYTLDTLLSGYELFNAQDTTFIGSTGAPADVIISGNGQRVFDIFGGVGTPYNVTFESLTIQNGLANDGSGGGGINAGQDVDLLLTNIVVQNNTADFDSFLNRSSGGGIQAAGNVTIDNSIIRGNTATRNGGGIDFGPFGGINKTLRIQNNSVIEGNVAGDALLDLGVGGGVFAFNSEATTIIQDSLIDNNDAGDSGGGVYASFSSISVDNSTFLNNEALGSDSGGGGLYVFGNGPTGPSFAINGGRFEGNTAVAGAGGFESVDAPGTIDLVRFEMNRVTGTSTTFDSGGGGIVVISQNPLDSPLVEITNTLVINNTAPVAGGIAGVDANLTISDTSILDNNAVASGGPAGGIGIAGSSTANSVTIQRSVISGNTADSDAGGIGSVDVDLLLVDTTIDGNVSTNGRAGGVGVVGQSLTPTLTADRVTVANNNAFGVGGGIGVLAGAIQLTNVTVSDNTSNGAFSLGGGIFADLDANSLIEFSTIASNNSDDTNGSNLTKQGVGILDLSSSLFADGDSSVAGFFSLGHNLDQSGTIGLSGIMDQNNVDPLLGPLLNNGGFVPTRALGLGSPAIDTATIAGPAVDARGFSRPEDGDGDTFFDNDIGAFEAESLLVPEADLSITKSDNADPVSAGTQLVYTIDVFNNGPDTATDVAVTDTLPADVSFVSANFTTGSGSVMENAGILTISMGDLADQQFAVVDIVVDVAPDAGDMLDNFASVIATPDTDPNTGDNDVLESTLVERTVDVSVAKSVSGSQVAGQTATFTIDVTNTGPGVARGVTVTDMLDADLTLVPGSFDPGTSGVTIMSSGQNLSFDVGTLGVGVTESVQFSFDVAIASSAAGLIPNQAFVTTTDIDTFPGNDSDTVDVNVQNEIDLSLQKTVDRASAVPGLDQLVYTIIVDNLGPSDAFGVQVTDTLPPDLLSPVINAPTASDINFDSFTGVATINYSTIPAGGSEQVTITVDIAEDATGVVVNPASVSASFGTELDLINNDDTAQTSLIPEFDVSVVKNANDPSPDAGTNVSYAITVRNDGPSTATNVVLSDDIPAGLTFISGVLDGNVGTQVGSDVVFPAITLDTNETVAGSLVFAVDANAGGGIINTATVTTDTGDVDSSNDSDMAIITVSPTMDIVDMVTTISDDIDPVMPGEDVTFTVTIDNQGTTFATNIESITTIPPEFTVVSAQSSPFGSVTVSGNTVTTNLISLDPGITETVTIIATASNVSGSFQTDTSVTSSEIDVFPADNMASELTTIASGSLPAITGHAFCDANDNGQEDIGETVNFTTVFLDEDGDRQLDVGELSTQTDDNGDYEFFSVNNLSATVVIDIPSSCNTIPPSPAITTRFFDTGHLARAVTGADFDRDGDQDILVASDISGSVTVLRNDDGEFAQDHEIFIGHRPWDIAALDLPTLSAPFVAVAGAGTSSDGGAVFTYEAGDPPEPNPPTEHAAGSGPLSVAVADFDHNDVPDVVTAAFRSSDLQLSMNESSFVSIGSTRMIRAVTVGDVDDDGNPDIVFAGFGFPDDEFAELAVLLGDGEGGFSAPIVAATTPGIVEVRVASLGPDPHDVSVLALSHRGDLMVYDLNGGLNLVNTIDVGAGAVAFDVGRFNPDSLADLVVANLGAEQIDLYVGNGNAGFDKMATINHVSAPADVAAIDFDNDGIHEIAVANFVQDVSGQANGQRFAIPSTVTMLFVTQAEATTLVSPGTTSEVDFGFPSAEQDMLFDVSGEGELTSLDALLVMNALSGISAEGEDTGNQRAATDVNGNGETTGLDALLIINQLAIQATLQDEATETLELLINQADDGENERAELFDQAIGQLV